MTDPPDGNRIPATQTSDASPLGRVRQGLAVLGAVVCLILAAAGFFLPLLPCTPFVLLASYLLVRGSPALHQRLRSSRLFGRVLNDWENKNGIQPRDKVRAIVVVVASLILTMIFGNSSHTFRFLTLFFVTIGLWVILRLPLAKDLEDGPR